MRIGVVIPVRNRPGLVLEALESVRSQTVAPSRVIVVDDGSTDQTAEAVQHWLTTLGAEGWSLLRTEHAGAARARQLGLLSAGDVELVAFLDSDDLWPPDLLASAVEVLRRRPELIGASADRRMVNEQTGREHTDDFRQMVTGPMRWMIGHDAGFGSCSVIRAAALRSIGGYPTGEVTGHDIELFAGLLRLGPWGHIPSESVTFRRHHTVKRSEADHIYRQVPDANIRYARLYERAWAAMPASESRRPEVRRSMSRRWFSAAKTAYRLNDNHGALACLAQARKHQRISVRAAVLKWKIVIRFSRRVLPSRPSAS